MLSHHCKRSRDALQKRRVVTLSRLEGVDARLPVEEHVMRMEEQAVVDKGDGEDDIDDADDQARGGHALAFEISAAAHAAVGDGCEDDGEDAEYESAAEQAEDGQDQ